jgi:hypothetical protein
MEGYTLLTVAILLVVAILYLHAIKRVLEASWEKLDAIQVLLLQLPGRMKG